MPSTNRPEWTRASAGIPVDTVVRINGGTPGARQDIQTSRNRVSVVRPGSLQPKPEDEYDVTFVYGAEAANSDIHERSISPLIRKFIEGYNVCVLAFGATGSGKTTTLEGGRGKDRRGSSDGDGLVHLAIDELFELVHGKAVTVGEAVAKRRRMPSSKGFDFFVESSFVEVYNEQCHDLYSKGASVASNLPVLEDVTEGYLVTGLSTKASKNSEEFRTAFNTGRANRDTQMMDLGSVHERTAAIFTISLSQYAPAAVHGEEDRIMMSKLTFVDMPGAEMLGMDPEVLRLREGVQLNKSLLAFSLVLRRLAQEGSSEFVGYDDAVLTRLLSDALGGNCLALMIGTVRQGDWESSSTTLRQLTTARGARNYPIINHSRARGLVHKLRFRLMNVMVSCISQIGSVTLTVWQMHGLKDLQEYC
eukprot:GHUV01039231.1.p1 GENE.GHUV01039231.1~~GHUV01039231.1.p1  ORF type:complete len:419 (+),score=96.69 GHUV01039231.1:574-1830(+)